MFGNDLKVGLFKEHDVDGNFIVTNITRKDEKGGKSIWTVTKQIDFDNDDKFDETSVKTIIYKNNKKVESNEVIEKGSEKTTIQEKYNEKEQLVEMNSETYNPHSEETLKSTNAKRIYETKTGRHVKTIIVDKSCIPDDPSTNREDKCIERYKYNDEGKVSKITCEFDEDNDGTINRVETTENTYHQNGKRKTKTVRTDINNDGNNDTQSVSTYDEKGHLVEIDSNTYIKKYYYSEESGTVTEFSINKETQSIIKNVYGFDDIGIDYFDLRSSEVIEEEVTQDRNTPPQEHSSFGKIGKRIKKAINFFKRL